MKENIKGLDVNMGEYMEQSKQIQQQKLMQCRDCGEQIDHTINNGNHLCKECYNIRQRQYYQENKERIRTVYDPSYKKKQRERIKQVYDGLYLYMIIDTRTNRPLYIGSSTNIYNRHDKHYNSTRDTAFAKYRVENGLDRAIFKHIVLDLSFYKDSLILDEQDNDLLLLEHFTIANTYIDHLEEGFKFLNNQMLKFDFSEEQIERIEYLHELIDMSNYISYEEIVHKKNTYQSLLQDDKHLAINL